jgi:hypothetical protein
MFVLNWCYMPRLPNLQRSIHMRPTSYLPREYCSLSLSVYGYTALWTLVAFSVSSSYTQSVGLLGRGISPSEGRYLHTE